MPDRRRSESICLWLISVLLFMATASGGMLLVLAIILPEDEVTRWFPEAGLVLVGTPWIFWFFMGVYRCLSGGAGGDVDGSAGGGAVGGKEIADDEGAVLMEENVASSDHGKGEEGEGGAPLVFAMALEVPEGGGDSVGKESSMGASCSMSRECEVPLTLAMSS